MAYSESNVTGEAGYLHADCHPGSSPADPPLDRPYSKEKYALFLEYYNTLREDWEDGDRVALRKLNAERRRAGLGWTLEYPKERREESKVVEIGGENPIYDSYMEHTPRVDGNAERAEGVMPYVDDLPRAMPHMDDLPRAPTPQGPSEDTKKALEVDIVVPLGDESAGDPDRSWSHSEPMDIPSLLTPTIEFPTTGCNHGAQNEECPTMPAYDPFLSPLSPLSPLPATPPVLAASIGDHHVWYNPEEESSNLASVNQAPALTAESKQEDTSELITEDPVVAPDVSTSQAAYIRGPSSIYDLDGILTPIVGTETTHIRDKLYQWKQLELSLVISHKSRPTRSEAAKIEKGKAWLARELRDADAELVSIAHWPTHLP